MFYFFPVQSFWQLCKAFGEVLNHFFLLNINFEVHFSFMRSADLRSFQLIHFYAEVSLFACSFARIHLFLSGKNIFGGKDWAWVRLQELKVLNLFFSLFCLSIFSLYEEHEEGKNFFFKSLPLLYDLQWYNSCKTTSLTDRERENKRGCTI